MPVNRHLLGHGGVWLKCFLWAHARPRARPSPPRRPLRMRTAARDCLRDVRLAAESGQPASLGRPPEPSPVSVCVNLNVSTPCGVGPSPTGLAASRAPTTREAGTQTDPVQVLPLGAPAPREPWAYAVWAAPEAPELVGVHTGGGKAWEGLAAALGGYSFKKGHRLRRFPTEALAHDGFRCEAGKHGLSSSTWRTVRWG